MNECTIHSLPPSVSHFPASARGLGIQGPADMTLRPVACVRKVVPQWTNLTSRLPALTPTSAPLICFSFSKGPWGLQAIPLQNGYTMSTPRPTPEKASFHLREMNKPFLFWRAEQWRPRLGTAGGAVREAASSGLIWGWPFVFSLNKACGAGAVAAGVSGKPICR